jgi:hypothetical protein
MLGGSLHRRGNNCYSPQILSFGGDVKPSLLRRTIQETVMSKSNLKLVKYPEYGHDGKPYEQHEYVEQYDDPDVTTASDGTVVNMVQAPIKTENGFEYLPGNVGMLGKFRFAVNYDLAAAALLQFVMYRFRPNTRKLNWLGKEWIAHSAWEWTVGAGLTEHEYKNRALPELEKCQFIEIRQRKLRSADRQKKLWIHVDMLAVPKLDALAMPSYTSRMLGKKIIGAKKIVGNPN